MHEELVERRRWISENRFLHALNYCMVLPGPEAQQLATYIGWLMHRTWGGIVAGGLFVLPSLFILVALSWVYGLWPRAAGRGPVLRHQAGRDGVVVHAAWRRGSRALKNAWLWASRRGLRGDLCAGAARSVDRAGGGRDRLVGGRAAPDKFAGGGHGAARQLAMANALIDDDADTAARASRWRLQARAAGLPGLWARPHGGLVALSAGTAC